MKESTVTQLQDVSSHKRDPESQQLKGEMVRCTLHIVMNFVCKYALVCLCVDGAFYLSLSLSLCVCVCVCVCVCACMCDRTVDLCFEPVNPPTGNVR